MLKPNEIATLQKLLKRKDDRLPIVFSALGDPRRCTIFRSFLRNERLCVSDVARLVDMSMSLASQHLKVLEVTGLVVREKEGRTVYYRANTDDELVRAITKAVN
ncbi:MAG TPA: metalloregulator ArsR/SmtB family transcription factor [Candidatus Paceibacterota bacterium]|nr:metalloregulator ArsR/SmtB family transcription factor [Candidatus Paceibacterota bacterium]